MPSRTFSLYQIKMHMGFTRYCFRMPATSGHYKLYNYAHVDLSPNGVVIGSTIGREGRKNGVHDRLVKKIVAYKNQLAKLEITENVL